jgi:hypothetical protein
MHRFRRDKLTLVWSLWIACLAIATAPACLAHPAAHDHDSAHPSLCIDTSSPMAQRADRPTLFADPGAFPPPSKSLPRGVFDTAIHVHLASGLNLLVQPFSPIPEPIVVSPSRLFPVVLRL